MKLTLLLGVICLWGCHDRHRDVVTANRPDAVDAYSSMAVYTGEQGNDVIYAFPVKYLRQKDAKALNALLNSDRFEKEYLAAVHDESIKVPWDEYRLDCAIEAGSQTDAFDEVLRQYYTGIGLDLSGDPDAIVSKLLRRRTSEGQSIAKKETTEKGLLYEVACSDGPLSGGAWAVRLVNRRGLWLPTECRIAAIF